MFSIPVFCYQFLSNLSQQCICMLELAVASFEVRPFWLDQTLSQERLRNLPVLLADQLHLCS